MAGAINEVDTTIANAENKIVDVENRFQTLTTEQQQDAEVIDARQGKTSLVANIQEIKDDLRSHEADDVSQGNPHGIDAKANKIQESWKTPELLNGWTHLSPIRYRKTEFNELVIRGRGRDGLRMVVQLFYLARWI